MKITPAFIDHEKFHTGKWLLPVKRPSWYYFAKAKNDHTITNKDFLKSVDPPLKSLVRFLHKHGIKTTPSCSGHHKSEKDFSRIYDHLAEDKAEIRKNGLELKDIESGKTILFRDKSYRLPWTKKAFLEKVLDYQRKGIIGIRLERNDERKKKLLKLKIPGVRIKAKTSLILILIEHGDGEHKALWRKIDREVKKIITNYRITNYQ